MKLVILAGGLGTRISEETDFIPKPMVLIGDKPILWHIIKYYSAFNFSKFIICGGYKIEIIKNFFINVFVAYTHFLNRKFTRFI
jgi:glucose-1-phosphate cytidylyltransferase